MKDAFTKKLTQDGALGSNALGSVEQTRSRAKSGLDVDPL